MEKDKIFFGENGLTSTSANFIANLAKEMYRSKEEYLNSIVFYTTTVKLLGTNDESLLKEGISSTDNIYGTIKEIAQLKSLIAWLREAIKAKERLSVEAENISYGELGIEIPEVPVCEKYLTEDDVISSWNIKQRNRYYYLEAFCATIGEYIHPNGSIAAERNKLQKVIQEPHTVSGTGRDTLMYTRTPSLPVEEVEETYMTLQQKYRAFQAELNSLKHQIEDTIQKDIATKRIQYESAVSEYRDTMRIFEAQLASKRKEAVQAVTNLKIIIPDSLQTIYDMVKSTGK